MQSPARRVPQLDRKWDPNRFQIPPEAAGGEMQEDEDATRNAQQYRASEVESQLLDRELKYHYLIADERLRKPAVHLRPNLIANFRALFAPRPMLTQERGIQSLH